MATAFKPPITTEMNLATIARDAAKAIDEINEASPSTIPAQTKQAFVDFVNQSGPFSIGIGGKCKDKEGEYGERALSLKFMIDELKGYSEDRKLTRDGRTLGEVADDCTSRLEKELPTLTSNVPSEEAVAAVNARQKFRNDARNFWIALNQDNALMNGPRVKTPQGDLNSAVAKLQNFVVNGQPQRAGDQDETLGAMKTIARLVNGGPAQPSLNNIVEQNAKKNYEDYQNAVRLAEHASSLNATQFVNKEGHLLRRDPATGSYAVEQAGGVGFGRMNRASLAAVRAEIKDTLVDEVVTMANPDPSKQGAAQELGLQSDGFYACDTPSKMIQHYQATARVTDGMCEILNSDRNGLQQLKDLRNNPEVYDRLSYFQKKRLREAEKGYIDRSGLRANNRPTAPAVAAGSQADNQQPGVGAQVQPANIAQERVAHDLRITAREGAARTLEESGATPEQPAAIREMLPKRSSSTPASTDVAEKKSNIPDVAPTTPVHPVSGRGMGRTSK
jgi:hypothetical protein